MLSGLFWLDRRCPSPVAVAGTLMTLCIALSAGQPRTDRYGDPEVTEMRGAWVQRAHGDRVAYDSISDDFANTPPRPTPSRRRIWSIVFGFLIFILEYLYICIYVFILWRQWRNANNISNIYIDIITRYRRIIQLYFHFFNSSLWRYLVVISVRIYKLDLN